MHDSDFEFVRLMKADDMTGFDMLYRKYSERIFNFAYGILKSRIDAEEIVQDVFYKVWEKRDTIREDISFSSFIFTVTYNASISFLRKRFRETKFYDYLKSIQHFEVQDNVSTDIEYAELNEKASRLINKLPGRQKEVYLLSREEGLTYKEIAEKLQISVNTVENHMVKALRFLREHLGKISNISVFAGLIFFL